MVKTGYTVLGWVVWQIGSRVAKRKLARNRRRLAAVAVTALGVIAAVAAARGGREE